MTQQTKDFLTDNIDIWQRQQVGNDKHLNQRELDGLMAAALDIDGDDTDLSPWCHDCRLKLIKKVFGALEATPEPAKQYKGIKPNTNGQSSEK